MLLFFLDEFFRVCQIIFLSFIPSVLIQIKAVLAVHILLALMTFIKSLVKCTLLDSCDPFEHILSSCNHREIEIDKTIETPEQLFHLCAAWHDRFSFNLTNSSSIFSRAFCFHFETMTETLQNLEYVLQPRYRRLTEPRDFLIKQLTSEAPRGATPSWLEELRGNFTDWA